MLYEVITLAALLDRRDHLVGLAVERFDNRLFTDRHALLFELLLGETRDLGILDRQDPVHHLDHRHLGAQGIVETREFDADRARADA